MCSARKEQTGQARPPQGITPAEAPRRIQSASFCRTCPWPEQAGQAGSGRTLRPYSGDGKNYTFEFEEAQRALSPKQLFNTFTMITDFATVTVTANVRIVNRLWRELNKNNGLMACAEGSSRHRVELNSTCTVTHQVIDLLSNSSWYRLAPALTFRTRNESAEVDSLFPDVHEMQEVVLAIRQLYSSDNLFNRAVNCHAKLCGDSKKVDWVGMVKKQFNDFLDSPNGFPMLNGVTVRELMDLFLYGGKFAHANQTEKQQKLHALILAHGRAQVVMAVQTSFRRVVDSARLVYPVLMQDYFHWLAAGKCPKPPPMALMNQLLFSGREQVHIKKG